MSSHKPTRLPPAPVVSLFRLNDQFAEATLVGTSGIADTSTWRLKRSVTGIGNPTTHPSEWTNNFSPDGDGAQTANWNDVVTGSFFIAVGYQQGGVQSAWGIVVCAYLTGHEGDENMTWAYVGTNPEFWYIQTAPAYAGPWTDDSLIPGSDRVTDYFSGVYYRLRPVNGPANLTNTNPIPAY